MKSIAPVVNKYQKVILLHQRSSTGSAVQSNSRNFEEERDSFIANLSEKLEGAVVDATKEEVC